MYCAVVLLLVGWSLLFESVALAIYTLVVAVGFHLRVVFGEEPWLAQTHGAQWSAYSSQVRRWFGRKGSSTGSNSNG